MTRRIYLITEGVHDVAFLSRILVRQFELKQAETLAELDKVYRAWVQSSCKWPHKERIDRASVPAPEIYVRPGLEVALANAEGIDLIRNKLFVDLEHFSKSGETLDAIGIVLDSDDSDPSSRRKEMVAALDAALLEAALPRPARTGVFVLPDDSSLGTLEDILIPLGKSLYPGLFASADVHIQAALNGLAALRSEERKAFKRPSGRKKALLSAVAAVLKPGKAIQATLKDNRWVSQETLSGPLLAGIVSFLRRILALDLLDTP